MGGFSLTRPGLAEDQGQGVDPSTGMPIQLPPIIKFFKNAALRGHQAALDEMMAVHPSTSDVSGQISPQGQSDNAQITQNQTPQSPLPKFFQPSFSQTTRDPQGLPTPVNPAETKLGKLAHILGAAAQGGLAGWGTYNAAAGADRARQIPIEMAQQRQQLQAGGIANQQAAANLRMTPLSIAERQAQIEQTLAQTKLATEGAAGGQYQVDPATGGYAFQHFGHFGQPVGPSAGNVVPPGLLKPKVRGVTVMGEDGTPQPAVQNLLTGEVTDERGQAIPNAQIFEGSLVPKTTTGQESTDLMGNTRSSHTVTPTLPAAGSRSSRPAPQSFVQGTPGGPLAPQGAPSRQRAGNLPSTPQTSQGGQGSGTTNSQKAGMALPPDVEQRLAASGLKPQEQAYVRGLLNYQGQMPSPRAKNYASTLGVLTQIDPNFNASNYDANKKTFLDYTPGGTVGKQALAFNTSIAHLNMLDQAADALKNNNLQALNKIANFFKVQTGNSAVTTFKAIADAVNGEVSKTFKGTATEGELGRVGANFDPALGPDQIKNNIRATVGLLNGKMGEMESAYLRQIGRPKSMVSPEAQQGITRLMSSPQTHTFSKSGFIQNNPKGNVDAAAAAATAAGYQVID